ncbi:HD domain-containing protein [Streptomyces sp. YJ-C3]
MDEVRRALLLGVGRISGGVEGLEPLDAVADADLRRMESVLGAAGYHVETVRDAHRSTLKKSMYEFARDIPADGTLLLYFTGHGITVGGKDYLVPADAAWPSDGVWQELYTDSLLPAGIGPLLKDCKARTVLWVIDACRTDQADDGVPFGNSIDNGPPAGGYAVLTGCSSGERSGYGPEGSFFTQGLAEALGPLSPARTVAEVFATARAATGRTARSNGLAQTPVIKYGTHHEARTRDTEICFGRSLMEDWLAAALDTPLWSRVANSQHSEVERFKKCLATFVEQCARTLHHAQDRLPHEDPWADDAFAVRLLSERLPHLLPATVELSAIEVAALVAATFLHEVTWAGRLSQAAEISPYDLDRWPGSDAHRRHYEQICEQHRPVARRAAECRTRGRERDTTAVTMWLVHRWISDRFETDDVPVAPALARELLEAMGITAERAQEPAEALCAMAAQLGIEEPAPLSSSAPEKVLLASGRQTLRVRPLTLLLRLAAALAVDVRRFPDVVAEHLGVTDPVLPEQVIGVARELVWVRESDVLHLDAPCPHQAVHAALGDIVDRADELVTEIAELAADMPAPEEALLAGLPRRVTDRDLRPGRTAGQPSYEVPLLRFHLAQTEVRELLMGERLYGGEPNLALRELYQNAMDACRYRAMRWRYLRGRGTVTDDWTGEISFTEGEDENGRYIECRDNGVGMSAEQLKHTFTRAGSRFERSKSFRREQARWLRHDPELRLYPNSRFGIGVFSYFMLAEEMTIVTRQVSPEGIPSEHALRVDIPSSGSLFRIRRHNGPDDGLSGGGTRVRLYLRDGALSDTSCVQVLRELVRVTEFDLRAEDADGRNHTWRPDVLQPSVTTLGEESLEAGPQGLWWVTGEGAVLCDGIVTDQTPFGYVLNLTGEHAGVLSVSRKELQDYDRTWEAARWREGAAALGRWSRLTMDWLWEADRTNIALAGVLADEWRGQGLQVRQESGKVHDLDSVGWFHPDADISGARSHSNRERIDRWRAWRSAALAYPSAAWDAISPHTLTGHPVPEPGDGHTALAPLGRWTDIVQQAVEQQQTLAQVLRRRRRLLIASYCDIPPLSATHSGGLDWVPSAEQGAFAARLNKAPRSSVARFRERRGAVDPRDLALDSAKLSMPLGALALALAPFIPLGAPSAPRVPEEYRGHICDEAEIDRLFLNRGGIRFGRSSAVTGAADVRLVCDATGDSPEQVLGVLAAHAWLGWTVPDPDDVRPWMELQQEDFALLNDYLVESRMEAPARLSWRATAQYALRGRMSLGEAEDRLASHAATLKLAYARHYASAGDPARHVRPTPLLATYLDRWGDRLITAEEQIPLSDLLGFDEETLDQLRTLRIQVPQGYRMAQQWRSLSLRARFVLSGQASPNSDDAIPAEALTTATLFNGAGVLNESLREAWQLARSVAASVGVDVADVPGELWSHRPTDAERSALLGYVNEYNEPDGELGSAVWVPLTPPRLANAARTMGVDAATAYTALLRLRPLGAQVPELPEAAVRLLRAEEPDLYDLHVLETFWPDRLDGESTLTPLNLVQTAARIGDSAQRTATRIAPYLPLLAARQKVTTRLTAAPDDVPRWQDLVLLSQHLDGVAPTVEGRLTAAGIARAADAVGEPPAWVTERLRLYSGLFGLRLTEEPCDD